jgi:hypothetical protein
MLRASTISQNLGGESGHSRVLIRHECVAHAVEAAFVAIALAPASTSAL